MSILGDGDPPALRPQRFRAASLEPFRSRWAPRILVVTDGRLTFLPDDPFGLWRLLHAIGAGVSNKPLLTLAHRSAHASTVRIESDEHTVRSNFDFAAGDPPVSRFDQIWMFADADDSPGTCTAPLSDPELRALGEFMNHGGGTFATGGHGSSGQQMCGSLPRLRFMRDWSTARGRVALPTPSRTQAGIHPLLRLPSRRGAGSRAVRCRAIDVFPHHELDGACHDVAAAAALNGTYNFGGQAFEEFRPSVVAPEFKVGAEIVAYALAHAPLRSYGAVGAYDGRRARPYSGKSRRPGRIVCASSWRHYVNMTLDGTGTGGGGLGRWREGRFLPSPALNRMQAYFRNTVAWLQPPSARQGDLLAQLVELRFHPLLYDALRDPAPPSGWDDFVSLGRSAARWIADGPESVAELVEAVLLADRRTETWADWLAFDAATSIDVDELRHGILGGMLLRVAQILEPTIGAAARDADPEHLLAELPGAASRVLRVALEAHAARAKRTLTVVQQRLDEPTGS
jgi:hypothetical protein